MGPEGCRHRSLLVTDPVYAWPDGTPLHRSPRLVECACGKQWTIGLTGEQHRRLLAMRPMNDRRSPFELGPEILRELP